MTTDRDQDLVKDTSELPFMPAFKKEGMLTDREALVKLLERIKQLAFEIPAPNIYTPRIVQECQTAIAALTARGGEPIPEWYLFVAYGEGQVDVRFCFDRSAVRAAYAECFAGSDDVAHKEEIDLFIESFDGDENWSCEGRVFSEKLYCAELQIFKMLPQDFPKWAYGAQGGGQSVEMTGEKLCQSCAKEAAKICSQLDLQAQDGKDVSPADCAEAILAVAKEGKK